MVKLRQWQEDFVNWYMLKWKGGQKSVYLAADVGTGKTIASLAALHRLKIEDVTILAPLSAHSSWYAEGKRFGIEFKLNENLFTYEKFVRLEYLPITDFLILDEAHRVKNPSAKITKILTKYYSNTPKLLLSGTPQDKLWDLYSQYKLIDPLLWDKPYSKWIKEYFFLDGFFKPKALIKEEYKDLILRKINPYTFRVKLEDVAEIPELEIIDHILPKNRVISKRIKQFNNENLNPVTSFISEYAISQGIDPDEKVMFNFEKINWVIDYLEDNPKTIVFSLFRTPVEYIREKYKDKFYYVLGDDKKDLNKALNKADKPIIATYSLKEGANLQAYKNIVYMSLPLSYRDYYQSRGRIYRSGQKSKVLINHLYMQPIDYEVGHILANKKELNEYVRNRIYLREEA